MPEGSEQDARPGVRGWPCAEEFGFITGDTRVLGKEWSHHETRFQTWKISEAIKIFSFHCLQKHMRTLIPGTLQITAKVPLVMSQGKSPLKARIIC